MTETELCQMKLHEEIKLDVEKNRHCFIVTRVLNGWIYTRIVNGPYNYGKGKDELITSVFVLIKSKEN